MCDKIIKNILTISDIRGVTPRKKHLLNLIFCQSNNFTSEMKR